MEKTGLKGLDCLVGLIDNLGNYFEAKSNKEQPDMGKALLEIHNMLKDPNLSILFPNDLIYELNTKLNNITKTLSEIAKVNTDEHLDAEKKATKLDKLYKELDKNEKAFSETIGKNAPVFLSTLRTDLASKNSSYAKISQKVAAEALAKIEAMDVFEESDKETIKQEIEKLKTEELSIKGEKGEDLENPDNISSYNLEKAVDTVNLTESKQYSKDMMVKAITHRLQQISKELVALRKSKGDAASNYTVEEAIKLQTLITEQAVLTKELMNIKRSLLQTYKDLSLNSTNQSLKINETLLNNKFVKANNFVSRFAKGLLEKNLQSLKAKQGILEAKQKMKVLLEMDKLARTVEKNSGKKAYRSVIAEQRSKGDAIEIFRKINGKRIEMAAMPRIIKLRLLENQEKLYEESENSHTL